MSTSYQIAIKSLECVDITEHERARILQNLLNLDTEGQLDLVITAVALFPC